MKRRDFVKSGAGILGASTLGTSIVDVFTEKQKSETSEPKDGSRFLRRQDKYETHWDFYCICKSRIAGSKEFPVRPLRAVAEPGDLVNIVVPKNPEKNKTNERLYVIARADEKWNIDPDMLKFRVCSGKPEAPAFILEVLPRDLYIYTNPGCLIKCAQAMLKNGYHPRVALEQIRFAVLQNIAASETAIEIEKILQAENRFKAAMNESDKTEHYEQCKAALQDYYVALTASR